MKVERGYVSLAFTRLRSKLSDARAIALSFFLEDLMDALLDEVNPSGDVSSKIRRIRELVESINHSIYSADRVYSGGGK